MSWEDGTRINKWENMDIRTEGRGSRFVICPKCKEHGSLVLKPRTYKDRAYKYYHIEHSKGIHKSWCHLGKFENLSDEFKRIVKPQH